MIRVLFRSVADSVLVALLLFAGAGTLHWPRAWILLVVMTAIRLPGAILIHRVSPALASERAQLPVHAQQPAADRVLVLAVLATGFLGLPLFAALDRYHWHMLPAPSAIVASAGLALFAAGWMLKTLALRANAFATTSLRLQSERGHAVADTGPYAVVRHPFYAADPAIFIGLSLWLGSYAAALASIVPLSLMMTRLVLEERFLRRELTGYSMYAQRVRWRLIPGVW